MLEQGIFRAIKDTLIDDSTKFYLWGAGKLGAEFLETFGDQVQVLGFIDSDVEKQRNQYLGYAVIDPTDVKKEENVVILVCARFVEDEIFSILEKKGYHKYENAMSVLDFPSVYQFYKKNKLYFSHLPYTITDVCTLRCRHCSGLSTYIPSPQHHSLDVILEDFQSYFSYVHYVDRISITDGDPMTHPQFIEIMEAIGDRYLGTHTGEIFLFVNSVILPNEAHLQLFRKYKITVHVTDYGKHAAHLQKLEEMIDILHQAGVNYIIDESAKNNILWKDTGYPQPTNGLSPEGVKDLYHRCVQKRHCHVEFQKMMICGVSLCAHKAQYTLLEEGDYFDLSVFDETKREALLEFYLGYVPHDCLTNCSKCNGYGPVNQTEVPMGLQRE